MNPLQALHEKADAEFQPYAEIPIVGTFGEPQAEYAAIRKSAAIMDLPQRGILELTGTDRLSFLNNLVTNQTWDRSTRSGLASHTGVYAFFLNTKGRIVTDMNILELPDRTLLDVDARMVETLRQAFDKYLFAEQVKITPRTGDLHQLLLTGPAALSVFRQMAGAHVPELQPLASIALHLLGKEVIIFRDDPTGVPGYFIISPIPAAEPIWRAFTQDQAGPASAPATPDDLRFRGLARPVGWAAFNAARIEAGRPLFGIDFDESVLPAETSLFSRAVSLTKGCYLGQEIVARMHARGQVARQLVGIRVDSDALPIAGAKIYDEQQNEIGGITSSTPSPLLSNAPICLAYIKRPFASPGTRIFVPAEGALRRASVTALPFIKGLAT